MLSEVLNNARSSPKKTIFLIGLAMSLLIILPYVLEKGIYDHDDFSFHKLRLESYYTAVAQGNFFPKIFPSMANNYGYAADLFYPSILLLPFAFLRICGLPFVESYLGYQFIITLCTFFTSYYCISKMNTRRREALLFASIYTSATYRLLDQFIRGALGETLTFIFLPVIILGVYSLFIKKNSQWCWLTLGMTGLIYSHFITAYSVFWFLAALVLFTGLRSAFTKKLLINLIKATASTFFLSLWILLPIYEQTHWIAFNFSHQPRLWGIGLNYSAYNLFENSLANAATNWTDLKPGIGVFLLLIFIVALFQFQSAARFQKQLTLGSLALLVLSTNLFPWSVIKDGMFAFIQFPWRLLAFLSLSLSGLAVCVLKQIRPLENRYLSGLLLLLMLLVVSFNGNAISSFEEKNVNIITNDNYAAFHTTALGGGKEYLPVETDYDTIMNDVERTIITQPNATVNNYKNTSEQLSFTLSSENDVTVLFPRIAYIGYQLSINNQEIKLQETGGQLSAVIPKGTYNVSLRYTGTPLQHYSLLLSACTLLFLACIFFVNKHKAVKKFLN